LLDIVPGENADPCELIADMDEAKWVMKRAQKKLTELEKQALELYIEGLTYRDIADILNAPPKAVDNALQRAKRKLKEVFNAKRKD